MGMHPLGNQIFLINSTLKMTNTPDFNYDYDILIPAENINMDIQFVLSLILFTIAIKNLCNVKKWCFEKQVKPYKLYCINSNALIVVICNFYLILAKIFYNFFLKAGLFTNQIQYITTLRDITSHITFMWFLRICQSCF